MMPHLSLKLENRQSQVLTPRLQYAVRLLQLSSLDYEQELHEIAANNPFLEVEDERPPASAAASQDSGIGAENSGLPHDGDMACDAFAPEASAEMSVNGSPEEGEPESPWPMQDHWPDNAGASASAPRNGSSEGHTGALERMVADIGLRAHLRSQANLLPLGERDHALVCAVIESLDDDGYLRLDLAEIAALVDFDVPADACEMSTALKLVQSFEPAGVGARSLQECLLLQTRELEDALQDLVRKLVMDHLERLAHRDVAGIARLLGRPLTEVEAACTAVRRLDPHPGWRYGRSEVQFIKPDVIARKHQGKWIVQLNEAIIPRLKLHHAYAELFQQHREAKHAELASYLQDARWAVRNVEQRFSTILAVAQAIVRRQCAFLEYGALAMKPLALREIAEEVGVHESTVCRVINNKYMAAPGGLIELKQFFSRAMPLSGGGACSPMAIRGLVQEIIAAENPMNPLSDVEIAQRLARQGLSIARRTVTKYRQMLKIPAVELRRAP